MVNTSFTLMNGSIWKQLNDTRRKLAQMELQLSTTGDRPPQGNLDQELEAIHKEVLKQVYSDDLN